MRDMHVPNGYFHLWKTYIQAKGLEQKIAEELGDEVETLSKILLSPIAMQSSYEFFLKLIESTQKQGLSHSFIFEMAQYVEAEHFGVLGYMATRSESIAEALSYILRFSRLVIDGEDITPMQMYQEEDTLMLKWPYICEEYNVINELTCAMMNALAKKILPAYEFPLHKVYMAHDAIMPIYAYQKFYGCNVEFKHSNYCVVLNTRSLSLKPQQADPSLMQLLIQQAEDAIASKPAQKSIDKQLHLIIAEYLRIKQQAPKVEDIAIELHMSVRTLQRQLKKFGTSYKQILEEERMLRCEKLLTQHIEISEIATRLGYSDQSALARAFKAFYGMTLLEKKRQILKEENKI